MLQFLYTARQSGGLLKQRATSELLDAINTLSELGLARSFSLRHEFNSVWHRFLNPATTGADQTLNGTTGYEAAAQGLLAGINAARAVQAREPGSPGARAATRPTSGS